jgi:5-methyltetrahydropteroyltriglutamate--homocysteine methyltransferase
VLRKEVTSLVEAGARIIQLDEPAISSNPDEFPLALEAIQELTRDLKSYFILRHGYGHMEPLWKPMQKLPVDNLHLELVNSGFSALPFLKKHPTAKDLTLGIIDSHCRTVGNAARTHRYHQENSFSGAGGPSVAFHRRRT